MWEKIKKFFTHETCFECKKSYLKKEMNKTLYHLAFVYYCDPCLDQINREEAEAQREYQIRKEIYWLQIQHEAKKRFEEKIKEQ